MSRYYIQSVPKSGTYFTAAFLEELGYLNSGFHIHGNMMQHTLAYPYNVNVCYPTHTEYNVAWYHLMLGMPDNSLCFGHFEGALYSAMLPNYRFILLYRKPQDALIAEFIDFRFRRHDLPELSPETIQDDCQAFIIYLNIMSLGGHTHFLGHIIQIKEIISSNLLPHVYPPNNYFFADFMQLRTDSLITQKLCQFCGIDKNISESADFLSTICNKKTKTNAQKMKINRSIFWTEEACNLYQNSPLPNLVEKAKMYGIFLS